MNNAILCNVYYCKHNEEGLCTKQVVHIKFYKHSEGGPECCDYAKKES